MAYNLSNEFRFFNEEQVFGDNRLDIFGKYGFVFVLIKIIYAEIVSIIAKIETFCTLN